MGTWEAATDNDLSGYGVTTLDCYDSQVHDDNMNWNGATGTGANNYRKLQSASDCSTPFAGKKATGAQFSYTGASSYVFYLNSEKFARIESVCIKMDTFYVGTTYGIYAYDDDQKFINLVIHDCNNSRGGSNCQGLYLRDGNRMLAFGVIAIDGDGAGINYTVGAGEVVAAVCCTAIGNNYGFYSTGAGIAWSCYAADNAVEDFRDSAVWSTDSGWNASKDDTADLAGQAGDNYKNNIDLTDAELDSDYFAVQGQTLSWANGAADNAGRNPYNDLSDGVEDFDNFLRSDANGAGETKFTQGIEGNDRPTEGTADVSWDVGASQQLAAATQIPVVHFF